MKAVPSSGSAPEPSERSIISSVLVITLVTSIAALTGVGLSMYLPSSSLAPAVSPWDGAAREPTLLAQVPNGWVARQLPTIVTNLSGDRKTWVRLDLTVVVPPEFGTEVTLAQISQDTLAYLRTLKTTDFQGANDLTMLREDLDERVRVRTGVVGSFVLFRSFIVE